MNNQLTIFDYVEKSKPDKSTDDNKLSSNNRKLVFRYQCKRYCDVEWCSRICFERRGQIWDKTEHKWVRNVDGTILVSDHKSCDV